MHKIFILDIIKIIMHKKEVFYKDINLIDIIKKLHNPDNIGGFAIKNFLSEDFRYALLEEAKTAKYEKQKIHNEKTNVVQDLESYTLTNRDEDKFKLSHLWQREYTKLIGGLFENNFPYSIVMQHYKKGLLGISPHRDYLRDRNLISIFVLDGAAKLYICQGRTKRGAVELESSLGSLILLRAPRNVNEKHIRPIHYLDNVAEERYSLALRQTV